MLKVYGSRMCPDCQACKANFDYYKVDYKFIDVMESLKNLKDFLILRDTEPCFERLKKIHDIGLPGIVDEDGTVFTDWEKYLKDKGMEPIEINTGKACSLDHKGC